MLVWQDTHPHENMGLGLQEVLNKCQVPHPSLPPDKLVTALSIRDKGGEHRGNKLTRAGVLLPQPGNQP